MVDHAELWDIISYIEMHPEEWAQESWARKQSVLPRHIQDPNNELDTVLLSCGTAYCVAGHAVVRAGAKINWSGHESTNVCQPGEGGPCREISDYAMEVLGLESWQADELFHSGNTIERLKELAKSYSA